MKPDPRCKCCNTPTPGIISRMDPALGMVCRDCYYDLLNASDVLSSAGLFTTRASEPVKPTDP